MFMWPLYWFVLHIHTYQQQNTFKELLLWMTKAAFFLAHADFDIWDFE